MKESPDTYIYISSQIVGFKRANFFVPLVLLDLTTPLSGFGVNGVGQTLLSTERSAGKDGLCSILENLGFRKSSLITSLESAAHI